MPTQIEEQIKSPRFITVMLSTMQTAVAQRKADVFWDAKRAEMTPKEFVQFRDTVNPCSFSPRLVDEAKALNEEAPDGYRLIDVERIPPSQWGFGDAKYLFERVEAP